MHFEDCVQIYASLILLRREVQITQILENLKSSQPQSAFLPFLIFNMATLKTLILNDSLLKKFCLDLGRSYQFCHRFGCCHLRYHYHLISFKFIN